MPLTTERRRSAPPQNSLQGLVEPLSGDTARFVIFCLLAAVVFAMGGGSRADILSLPFLRPVAFAVAGYALIVARPGELREATLPLALLAALAAVMGLQLVPLPPEMWSALPGRQLYVQIAADASIPLGYRPLTLSPSRTLNALFALGVPLATILMVAIQSEHYRAKLFTVLLIGGAVSALFAIGQIAGPDNGPLYLYAVTNNGFPVGLFSNRNHQALLMVILLVLIAAYHARPRRGSVNALSNIGIAFGALVVFALILVAGSRAGLLLGVMVLPLIAWMYMRRRGLSAGKLGTKFSAKWWIAIAAGLAALVFVALQLSRADSLERLWSADALADNRVSSLPYLLEMMGDHWLFGIGFGAFQGAFMQYEPTEALTPFVLNQAHNDWIQFPMEGGLPATILLIVGVAWLVAQARRVLGSLRRGFDQVRVSALAILVLIALASVVDYPMRTPIFMMIAAIAFMELSRPSRSGRAPLH